MSWFTISRKVRSRAPEPPAPAEETLEPKRRPGRPKGSRECSPAKVLRLEVAGVRQEGFPHVPVELWNQVTAAIADYLRTVAGQLNTAYAVGIEGEALELLDATLPDAALALGRATMEALAAQQRGFHGSNIPCHVCENCLEYQGDVAKTIKTRIGAITLNRAYYYGPCGHSVSPLDMLLGVDGVHAVMPSLQDTVAWLTASMPYPEAVKVLERLCPSKFSLKAVETITATVAAEVQEAQRQEIQAMLDNPSAAASRNGELKPGVVAVEADGGFIRVRDHSEPTREMKLGVMGVVQQTPPKPRKDKPGEVDNGIKLTEKTYVGHFADPDTLFAHMQTEFFRRGFHRYQTVHGVSDGASWILPRIALMAQEGQEVSLVLDWWHADERVAHAAAALHGSGTDAAAEWRSATRSALWDDKHDEFFQSLKQAVDTAKTEDREALQEHYNFFDVRRHLLRYLECRNRGLPIGSGAMEGGVRFIGKDRMDRTGMRWNISGAEAILQLRCVKHSDRWEELAAKRSAERRRRCETARSAWNKAA